MMCWWADDPDSDEFNHLTVLPCLSLLSQMPPDVAGKKVDVERIRGIGYALVLTCMKSIVSQVYYSVSHFPPFKFVLVLNPSELFADIVIEREYALVLLLSLYGYWGICLIYGIFFVLEELTAAGSTYNNSQSVRRGVHFLLSTQNEEGGWGKARNHANLW
ncbi:hypothetical protein RHMOL_Rhmol02G0262000 [Rhododendron molle]|uniref:Uncharacterized protein n=1 Tax=Rhododendron molle TaxID=49168 RepID=A0ACC0PW04_RHOML|nr:hypothetical protein RHMOL_Rhmol02G0262000 [Rhododendron molle]